MMKLKLLLLTLILLPSIASAATCNDQMTLMSWNVLHVGQKVSGEKARAIGNVIKVTGADLVAIQETDWAGKKARIGSTVKSITGDPSGVKHKGIAVIKNAIERATGVGWNAIVSKPVGSRKHKEHYVFFYKAGKVNLISNIATFPDKGRNFFREPAAVSFKSGNFDFMIANIHVIWGKSVKQRKAEVSNLPKVAKWMSSLNPNEKDLIIVGDFNLQARKKSWSHLKNAGFHMAQRDSKASTLGHKGLANDYDHILMTREATEFTGNAGVYDFARAMNKPYKVARKSISDHIPVLASFCTSGRDDD